MGLFIFNDNGGAGMGNVFPLNAQLDLISISNVDLGDGTQQGFGEGTTTGDLTQITYDRSNTGPCPERLDAVVNTDFGVDILILAVGANFTLSDGSNVLGNGFTLPVGNSENPTTSVLIIYDTSDNNGSGVCVRREGSSEYNLEEPENVILYHEMSHAFHFANGDPLAIGDSGCTGSAEEQRAETDENDMRDQLGLPHRDATDHCGNPGCQSTCCVVASVSTGSPYSAEVNALRLVRDGLLRRSETGFDFFHHLHDDYYGFSPEVCRLMAQSEELRTQIRTRFVQPLTLSLQLLCAYAVDRVSGAELGQRFSDSVVASPEVAGLSVADLEQGRAVLASSLMPVASTPALCKLAELLEDRARPSAYVVWALLEPIRILLDALTWRLHAVASDEIGERLTQRFAAWALQMPLTEVWHTLSRYAVAEELTFLENAFLRDPETRRAFARRLADHVRSDAAKAQLIADRWTTEVS